MKMQVMNAKTGDQKDLGNKEFIFEPKFDGYRALCFVNKEVTFISRNNKDLTDDYQELDVRKNIKAKTAILDGEIIALDEKGKPSFQALQQGKPAQYVVFDILMKNGKKLIDASLMERKRILKSVVKNGKKIFKVSFTDDGKSLWKKIIKKDLEGLMAKLKESHYYPGKRKSVWLKIKRFQSIDCVIVGFVQKKRELSSLALGLYKGKELVYIGNVGTGFTQKDIADLYQRLHPLKVEKKPVINEAPKGIYWIKPKYTCEVKYAEITAAHRLRAPAFMRLRPDKKAKDCTISQFVS